MGEVLTGCGRGMGGVLTGYERGMDGVLTSLPLRELRDVPFLSQRSASFPTREPDISTMDM